MLGPARGAALAFGTALLLVGCTSTVDGTASPASVVAPTPGDDPLVDAPAVGTCHDIETTYQPLEVPPVVPCDAEHTGETAVVQDTGLALEAAYPTADGIDEGYLGDVWDEVCGYDLIQDYLQGQVGDQAYASYTQVLPTQEQWAAGARWVACDITYGYGQPEPAPGRMAGALRSGETAPYRACLDGDAQVSDVVACSDEHWAEQISGSPDIAEGTPFPADQAARAPIAAQCLPAAVDYLDGPLPADVTVDITTEDPDDWAGFPFATCVLVPTAGGTTDTSFRD